MRKELFLLMIAMVAVFASCSKDDHPKPEPKVVYIGGLEYNASDVSVAKYWKDGVGVALTDGNEEGGGVNSIFVANGNVYAAGYEKDPVTKKAIAKYWINDADHAVALTDGSAEACANSIFVEGNTVYVAGFEKDASGRIAKYWVNDKDHCEVLHASSSEANAITVSGGNVYVAGWVERINEFKRMNTICTYWKNKTATELTDGMTKGELLAIAVSGADIYVSGFERDVSNMMIAKYWKNDKDHAVTLSTPGIYAQGSSIFVSGADVQVVGHDTNAAGKYVAKCWKNDQSHVVTISPETEYHIVSGACMSANEILAVGICMDPWGGRYWKDGVQIPFATENVTEFTCVAVQ